MFEKVCCTFKVVVLLIKPVTFVDVLVAVSVAVSQRYLINTLPVTAASMINTETFYVYVPCRQSTC